MLGPEGLISEFDLTEEPNVYMNVFVSELK